MTGDFEKLRGIFLKAVEQHPPAEWDQFLDQACAGDEPLRREAAALLKGHLDAASQPGGDAAECAITSGLLMERPGTQIGPYKLLQQIGEGGMGTVFMAQQSHPVDRKVALKVIKPGMDIGQVIARFEAERQALAMMDHPNIAKVLDAGTIAGRPYFVMELVKGLPITQYCDQQHLPPRERLELFAMVCQAVQHAHQKGIIHRDLKPSNVLVAQYDGKAIPKVIDFGVAKATGARLTERTLFTEFGQVVGTLEYMSPEQAETNPFDIDTRSDIYTLGVLLYELLTGTTPLDRRRSKTAALLEVLRLIREEEPPKPSTRLSSTDELPSIAANRGLEPKKLSGLIRGELDWIVMKCLEKDRNRRYETANGLGQDIQRYLNDEHVLACPPSATYRVRKFARRNRAAIVMSSVVMFALLLVVAVVAGGLGWVSRDRAGRRLVVEQAIGRALEEARAFEQQAEWPEALEAVLRAEAVFASGEVSAELEQRLREALSGLWMIEKLEAVRMKRAHDLDNVSADQEYSRTFGEFGIDMETLTPKEVGARIRQHAAYALPISAALDDWAIAVRDLRKDASRWKRLLESARVADADPWRNRLRELMGREDLVALRGLADSSDISTLPVQSLQLMDNALIFGGDAAAAIAWLRKAQREHPEDFWLNYDLAYFLNESQPGAWEEALRFYQACAALRPDSYHMQYKLGWTLWNLKRYDESIHAYRRIIKFIPESAWPYDTLAHRLSNLPICTKQDAADAVISAKRAVEIAPQHGYYWHTLGLAYYRAGEWKSAITSVQKSMQLRKGGHSVEWFVLAMAHGQLGETELAHKWYDQAVVWMGRHAPMDEGLQRARSEAASVLNAQDQRRFAGHSEAVRSAVLSADGKQAISASEDKTIRRWDLATGKELACWNGHTHVIFSVAYSPNGKQALSGSWDLTMRLWDIESGKELRRFAHPNLVWCVTFSPDGLRALSGGHDHARLWDLQTGMELVRFTGHSDGVRSVVFSGDGQRVLSGSQDKSVRLWDAATGAEIRRFDGHTSGVLAVALSHDGQLALSGACDGTARLWQVETGKELACFRGHVSNVEAVAFSPDSRNVVTGGHDGTIRYWDLTGHLLYCISTQQVLGVSISADGQQVLSAHGDKNMRLFRLPDTITSGN